MKRARLTELHYPKYFIMGQAYKEEPSQLLLNIAVKKMSLYHLDTLNVTYHQKIILGLAASDPG